MSPSLRPPPPLRSSISWNSVYAQIRKLHLVDGDGVVLRLAVGCGDGSRWAWRGPGAGTHGGEAGEEEILGSHPTQPNRATDLCFSLSRDQSLCHSMDPQVLSYSRICSFVTGSTGTLFVALDRRVSAWGTRTPRPFPGFAELSLSLSSFDVPFRGELVADSSPGERLNGARTEAGMTGILGRTGPKPGPHG